MKFSFPVITFLSVLAGANANRSRMVLKFDHSVDLQDVAEAVQVVGAKVERQLACTRGLLISVDEKGWRALNDMEGMEAVPENEAHPVHERRLNGINTPQGNGGCDYKDTCGNLRPVPVLNQVDVEAIKGKIRTELLKDVDSFDGSLADSAGAIMRLTFHDAASFDKNDAANLSGLNGCVNKDNTGNAGLDNARAWLLELQGYLYSEYTFEVSIADLTVLAAITTVEVTINKAKEGFPDYQGELDVEFKYGRPDIDCACEEDFLPPPLTSDGSDYSFDVLDETMVHTMGFTRKEVTALMGTHTLGGLLVDHAGFPAFLSQASSGAVTESSWVGRRFGGNDGFDNGYYQFMVQVPWDKKETIVDGINIIEWLFGPFTYLNSDAALGFEIDFKDEHGNLCNRFGPASGGCNGRDGNPIPGCIMCPELANAYGVAVRQYAADNAKWLKDYSKAFQKMVDDLRPCRNAQLMTPE